jgi:GntR family galactonate operon transcriptional repressor
LYWRFQRGDKNPIQWKQTPDRKDIQAHYVGAADKVASDLAFHTSILRATQNTLLMTLGGLISVGLEHIFHSSLEATAEEDDRWIERHKLVFDAINSRNSVKAGEHMQKLLVEARDIQNERMPVAAKAAR